MNGGVSYAKSSRAKNPNPNARSGRRKFNRAVRDYLAHTGNGKPKLAGYKTVTDTLTKNKPRQACILDGAKMRDSQMGGDSCNVALRSGNLARILSRFPGMSK